MSETLRELHELFSKTDAAFRAGTITQKERDAFLRAHYGTSDEREAVKALQRPRDGDGAGFTPQSATLIVGFITVMLALFATLFYSTGGVTGAVVYEQAIGQTITVATDIPLALDGTTRVHVAGTIAGAGDASVTLVTDAGAYLLYTYARGGIATPHASMPRTWYEAGEPVAWNATDVSAAYLMTATDALPLGDTTLLEGLAPGAYTVKLIINDTALSQEQLPFTIVAPGTPPPSETFAACGEACNVNLTGNATLHVEIQGATMQLDNVILGAGNDAPVLQTPIPDMTGVEGVTIDLGLFFEDPDGDALLYDTSSYEGLQVAFDGSAATITGAPGSYAFVAYASDLQELTSSNLFTVTLLGALPAVNTSEPAPNVTEEPLNQTAGMANETMVNATNEPADLNISLAGCDDPDPNSRPLACIQDGNYFRPEQITIESKTGVPVAQLTPIGNLLLKGGVVERSMGAPAPTDYQLGYNDQGEFIPTLWIDTQTGDLHLRGTYAEANGNIPEREGYSAFVNMRGIILALYEPRTGDLVVRGNIVPYRREI